MRKRTATLAIIPFFAICAVITPARLKDEEVNARDAKKIATAPIPERNGKNVALTLEVRPDTPKNLPKGLTILVNGRQAHLYDNGRWPDETAGDGIYTAAGKTKDGKPLQEKTSAAIRSDQSSNHAAKPLPSIGCTFTVVKCPSTCTSTVFGTKCVLCVKIESCTITLF
jgi:hypothetical protein